MDTTQRPQYLTDDRTGECFDVRPESLTQVDHDWQGKVKLGIFLYLKRGNETMDAMVSRGPVASLS